MPAEQAVPQTTSAEVVHAADCPVPPAHAVLQDWQVRLLPSLQVVPAEQAVPQTTSAEVVHAADCPLLAGQVVLQALVNIIAYKLMHTYAD